MRNLLNVLLATSMILAIIARSSTLQMTFAAAPCSCSASCPNGTCSSKAHAVIADVTPMVVLIVNRVASVLSQKYLG